MMVFPTARFRWRGRKSAEPGSRPSLSDAYDFEDRLVNRNSGRVIFNYDGDGNHVSKTVTVGGVTMLFLVDDRNPTGYAQVLEELTSNSQLPTPAVTRVYAYGLDLISQDQLLDDGNGERSAELRFGQLHPG